MSYSKFDDDDSDTVTFENVECIGQTDRAIRVMLEDEPDPRWVPQSVVDQMSEVWKQGQEGALVVKRWWAEKEGWV